MLGTQLLKTLLLTIIKPLQVIALGGLGNHWRGLCISRKAFQTYAEAV
jgi:hypothetical protein